MSERYFPKSKMEIIPMSRKLLALLLVLGLASLAACGDSDSNADANNSPKENNGNNGPDDTFDSHDLADAFSDDCTRLIKPSEDAETNRIRIATVLNEQNAKEVLCLANGTYKIDEQLQLNVTELDGYEIRGESQDGTILDFKDQAGGGNGILVDGVDNFRAAHFTIKNTAGDGIKVQNARGVELAYLTVTWDGGPRETNGSYGVYPVLTEDVLIEHCKVSNASDAGIYVGQTKNVIVRHNEAFGNVAGLELENTSFADAHDNHLHDNTGGLLIFDLPNLTITDGSSNKVHNNLIENNNEPNFAPGAAIVANVPTGTGILLLSSSKNDIHNNTITGNQSLGLVIASYLALGKAITDQSYYPFSESNYIHDNVFDNNGYEPVGMAALIAAPPVPHMAIDGFINPDLASAGKTFEDIRDCFHNNTVTGGGEANFVNANLPSADLDAPTACSDDWTDFCHYQCEGTTLPPITL